MRRQAAIYRAGDIVPPAAAIQHGVPRRELNSSRPRQRRRLLLSGTGRFVSLRLKGAAPLPTTLSSFSPFAWRMRTRRLSPRDEEMRRNRARTAGPLSRLRRRFGIIAADCPSQGIDRLRDLLLRHLYGHVYLPF